MRNYKEKMLLIIHHRQTKALTVSIYFCNLKELAPFFKASIKPGTWNIPEHSGTFRNIPEHPGT